MYSICLLQPFGAAFNEERALPHCGMFAFPKIMTPAARSFVTKDASLVGFEPTRQHKPSVLLMP